AEFFFLIEEDDHNSIEFVRRAYPFHSGCDYVHKRRVRWFRRYIRDLEIDAAFINAQRIPDDMVVLAARKEGVPTFMLQHGMYIPFLRREPSFFLRRLAKSVRF